MPEIRNLNVTAIGGSSGVLPSGKISANSAQDLNMSKRNKSDFASMINDTAMSILASSQLVTGNSAVSAVNPIGKDHRSVEFVSRTQKSGTANYSERGKAQFSDKSTAQGSTVSQKSSTADFRDKLGGAVDAAASKVTQEVSQRLSVEEEAVSEAVNRLGLDETDLLTEEGVAKLMYALGGEDEAVLITDGSLREDLQAVKDMAGGILGRKKKKIGGGFGESSEKIKSAIKKESESIQKTFGVDFEEFSKILNSAIKADEETVEAAFASTDVKNNLFNEIEAEKTDPDKVVLADEAVINKNITVKSSGLESGQSKDNEAAENRSKSGFTEVWNADIPMDNVGAVNQFFGSIENALSFSGTTPAGASSANTQAIDILRQIVEKMTSELKDGSTTMDMQLNPQSLGRVNVSLHALEGADMTARFIVQNEAVKAALESQMPQLIQRFEEQGIKVGEVQVAVGSHAYDENSDQSRSREDAGEEHEKKLNHIGRMRRIQMDLSSMNEDDIEALDEEDRLTAEIMALEGNTVNYRA